MLPQYADFMYSIGSLDANQRDYFKIQCNKVVWMMDHGRWMDALRVRSLVHLQLLCLPVHLPGHQIVCSSPRMSVRPSVILPSCFLCILHHIPSPCFVSQVTNKHTWLNPGQVTHKSMSPSWQCHSKVIFNLPNTDPVRQII